MELNPLLYLKQLLTQEFPPEQVEQMIAKARAYSFDDIERVNQAIERFGAKAIFDAMP